MILCGHDSVFGLCSIPLTSLVLLDNVRLRIVAKAQPKNELAARERKDGKEETS